MNKQSNAYIIIYATVLVVVVASVLSFVSLKLKPIQQINVQIEKKSDILQSSGLLTVPTGDYNKGIEEQYTKYIKKSFLVNTKGDVVSENSADAFKALINARNIFKSVDANSQLPVFTSLSDSGEIKYIFPLDGTGLWGPIWGFIALSEDFDTVMGVVLGHQSETPGLGAEIATPIFEDQFKGKKLFKDGSFNGLFVLKGEGSSNGNDNAVDAISGGTITSVAVQDMFGKCLSNAYRGYIEKMRNEQLKPVVQVVDSLVVDSLVVDSTLVDTELQTNLEVSNK